ncbi:pentapeptide MXKDX repeat protein [Vallitalea okinawensis]|uniref:pentapeptide MXKDX repeat protein n=1 Tax=Vallitalea okinawensis TaxID=2078660 RepID=UPI00147868ED|nr:pentapeptide MXKDX repeat protein [Vallitalea okinawensis]
MKRLKVLVVALIVVLGVVGCTKQTQMKQEDTMNHTNSDKMKDDHKSEDKMEDQMKDDKMSEDEMKNDEMKDDNMSEDKMENDEMKDDNMSDDQMEEQVMNKGREATLFSLQDLDGNTHALSDYNGEKVYVKFWASWCSICLAGLDELNTLSGEDNDFKVLTVVSPGHKGEQSVEDFVNWFAGLEGVENITVLLDEGGEISKAYGVRGYPTSVYIGSDGILVKTLPGHNGNEQIKSSFEEIY